MRSGMKARFLALVATLLASPVWSTTVVNNVHGIQVGADGKLQRFSGLVIGDDGKVVQVIPEGVMMKLAGVETVVDGKGRTLLPGLIDAHGHVVDSPGGDMGLGLMLIQLDVAGTNSIADLQQRLRRYAAANPGQGWVLGRGWNQELWSDKRMPTAADLDAIVQDRPVLLTRVDGHAAVANSAALNLAGITNSTADPEGGKIERDRSGRATGLLIDNAMQLVTSRIPPPTPAMMERGLEAAQEFLLANGLTAVADMGTSARGWDTMQRLATSGRLRIRVLSYADGSKPLPVASPTGWLFDDRLRMAGVKLYGDGALGSRGAWLKRPYSDQPDTSGIAVTAPDELRKLSGSAAGNGFQIAIHAIGDKANAEAISIFERLASQYPGDRRWRIEHAQVVDPADIPRIGKARIIASMQPVHQTSDRLMAEKRLGADRLTGAYAWASMLKSGAKLAFGSDFPVESPNPFPGLAAAISRQDMNGEPPSGWIPSERLTFEQALYAFTRDAAYAGFAEDKIGALEPGKWADFILVDRDVSTADPQSLARTQVLETWVAGKKVWERAPSAEDGERGK